MTLESTGVIAVTILEYFSGDEIGFTAPQTTLHTIYLLASGSKGGTSSDDYIRIFAPKDAAVTFYDQTLTPLTRKYISGGEVVEYRASELGFADDYSMAVVSNTPIAISWLEGPDWTALMIPQGIR